MWLKLELLTGKVRHCHLMQDYLVVGIERDKHSGLSVKNANSSEDLLPGRNNEMAFLVNRNNFILKIFD